MITSQLLKSIFPNTPSQKRDRFIDAFNKFLPMYEINSYFRVCAFLATGGIETDYLRTLSEYASGADYEGRRDLGNIVKGDGKRFKGRGFFHTTGRANYARLNETIGRKYNIAFTWNPEKLTEVEIAIESACIFWRDNKLAKYADAGNFRAIQGIVNTGSPSGHPNAWAKRNELYSLCKRRIPVDFSFNAQAAPLLPETSLPEPPKSETVSEPLPTVANYSNEELKSFSDKYLKHLPADKTQNILTVLVTRIFAGITAIWTLGLHGQIFLISIALITVIFTAYTIYKYHARIVSWITTIADSLLGNS